VESLSKFLWLVPVLIVGCSGTRPSTLGVKDGRLAPCPNSPNCVSTQSADAKHGIDPITYTTSTEEARNRLEEIVRAMPRTKIVRLEDDYMHLECTSRLFRFVDDVEFWFDDANKVIHCRSASRKGYSDLGVNRKRVEQIREQFSATGQGV
jgi:uncharacterized protein (DUF1499 family)